MSFHFKTFTTKANRSKFINYYLEKYNMRKGKIEPQLWEAFERARDRTTITDSSKVSLYDATNLINKSLSAQNHMSEFQVQGLFEKGLIRGEKIEKGQDKLGRKRVEFEILKEDIDHYIDLMKIWELFEKENLVKTSKHPEKGSGVVEYYVPAVQHRFGITEPETKGLVILSMLNKPFILNLIEELKIKK